MLENRVETAVCHFDHGLNCSQAILLTYGKQYGIDRNTAVRVARAFGGGMARMCETCGAVTGAYMVIGLKYDDEDEKSAKEATYRLAREFARRFKEKHGTINCKELTNCDLGTPEGQAYFRENNLHANCASYVRTAAEILERLVK